MSMQRACPPGKVASGDYADQALLFKALADPHRLTILATLAQSEHEVCVCDFTAGLPLNQPAVSHHLKVLRDAGMVKAERRGTWIYYTLAGDARNRLASALSLVLEEGARARRRPVQNVLFVCVHNSARSQMPEAFVNQRCGEILVARSAGLEAGTLNPLAVEVMSEAGIDIGRNGTQAVFDVLESGARFDYVVTVCDETSAEGCPVFPGVASRLHWNFPDPAAFSGSWEERLEQTRRVRDAIRARVTAWCNELAANGAR